MEIKNTNASSVNIAVPYVDFIHSNDVCVTIVENIATLIHKSIHKPTANDNRCAPETIVSLRKH